MFIKKIHLQDYKRFHDLTIDLGDEPKRLVALVGPNGCGKSSVFDAMLYRLEGYVGNIGEHQIRSGKYHSLKQDNQYDYMNIRLEFTDGDFDTVYKLKSQSGSIMTMYSFRSSFRYNNTLKIQQTHAITDISKNDYGASSASDIDQRIEQDYRRLYAKFHKYLEEQDVRLSEARAHIIGDLNMAIKNCIDIEISSLGNVEQGKGTLYFKKSDSDITFEYDVLSAGEKEVVDLLIDLYLREDVYTDSIYIFDEPELHLNTAIQRKLLIEINRMIPQNCQIWIATHSVGFLRALQEELKEQSQVIEFKAENKWASGTYTLTPIVPSRAAWLNLFATALDDLAKLVSPKILIYCEGRDLPGPDGTERGLDADVFNKIFNQQYPDVLFVSSGGNTELDQRSQIAIKILTKVFPDLKIWVLKDRDMASGRNTTEQDRQQYLSNNHESHRVLKRFEIENYLYDKEVLVAYCAGNGSIFNEEKYDSCVSDIVNDNLKDRTTEIKACCNIIGSINPEKFKRNLAGYITPSMAVYKELDGVIFSRK